MSYEYYCEKCKECFSSIGELIEHNCKPIKEIWER